VRNEAAGISLAVKETMRFADKPAPNPPTPASSKWSQQYRDEDPQIVIARLCAIWAGISGQPLPPILDASAHRWLYAKVTTAANDNARRHSDDGKMTMRVTGLGDRVSNRLLTAALKPILACADPRCDVAP